MIKKSEVYNPTPSIGVVRSTETTGGPTKQEVTAFNPDQHMLSYKAISGAPFFAKALNAKWTLTNNQDASTKLIMNFEIKFKGIGGILSPIVRMKLGKIADDLLGDFKFYVENGEPHPRKVASND